MTPQTDEVTHCSGNSNIESQCSMLEDSTNKSLVSIVDINCLLAEDLLEPPTDAHHGNGAAVTGGAVVEEGVHIMETLLIDMYDSSFHKAAFGQAFVKDRPPAVAVVTQEYIHVSSLQPSC